MPMRPSDDQRLEILKLEMSLIQQTIDKYDDLIFRNRNWFVTIWMGTLGLAITIRSPVVPFLAAFAALLYWFTEGMMRHQYWFKYVVRYRSIREWLNSSSTESISIYDLTNRYGANGDDWLRFRKSFLKLEPTIVYLLMACAALFVRSLIARGSVG